MNKSQKGIIDEGIIDEISIPHGTKAVLALGKLVIEGPKGKVEMGIAQRQIDIAIKNNSIVLTAKKASKREKKMAGTIRAHIKNMLHGVHEPYRYVLKICSGHFPMSVSVEKNALVVKNFFGEKIPRIMALKENVAVRVEGDLVIVESPDKERAGIVASDIEHLTKRSAYDRRIFQDGIYVIEKPARR